jgi:ADP-heptose:LPS heptosyltransferase
MKNEKYFDKKNKISKSFLKLIKILKNKKFEIYKNFLSNIKKFFIYRDKIKYKKFFLIKKENFVHKLKVKRFRNYPKAFVKVKDEYRYLYDRATALTEQPSTNNLFL